MAGSTIEHRKALTLYFDVYRACPISLNATKIKLSQLISKKYRVIPGQPHQNYFTLEKKRKNWSKTRNRMNIRVQNDTSYFSHF